MRLVLSYLLLLCVVSVHAQMPESNRPFTLADFNENTEKLEKKAQEVFESLTEDQRVAQMIITSTGRLGKPYDEVKVLVKEGAVGGVIFLSGVPEVFKTQIDELNGLSRGIPLIYSIDAEPSLFNSRLKDVPPVPKTADLETREDIYGAAGIIDSTIKSLGFQHNYAPVIDMSKENEAIGNRSFGSDSTTVVTRAMAFVDQSTRDDVVSTVKHFPGHGRVAGDTHEQLVYIDGELTEVSLYEPFIEAGVPSIMVAHIAVENNDRYNTNGMPSTLSPVIVNGLLREEMGYKGIIITDAMNMGAVVKIPNSGLLAAKAGCDLLLMPPKEKEVKAQILKEMTKDEAFKNQIDESVMRVIKLKLCLGMAFSG